MRKLAGIIGVFAFVVIAASGVAAAQTTSSTSSSTSSSSSSTSSSSSSTTTTQAPTTTVGCNPNYSGLCIPSNLFNSQVNCSSGANVVFVVTTPVRVIGVDVLGLDRDGDGIGCEAATAVATSPRFTG